MSDDSQSLSESNVVAWKELDWVEMVNDSDSFAHKAGLDRIRLIEHEKNIKARRMLDVVGKREVNPLVREW